MTVTIVNPAAEDVTERLTPAPRIASLRGARVALIDNSKHNADRFLDTLAAGLGLPEHPRVIVEHPLASRTPSEIEKVAVAAVARIAAGLSGQATSPASGSVQHVAKTRPAPARAQRRQLAGDFAEANE